MVPSYHLELIFAPYNNLHITSFIPRNNPEIRDLMWRTNEETESQTKSLFSRRANRSFELRMPEGSPGSSYSTKLPSQQASSPAPSDGEPGQSF